MDWILIPALILLGLGLLAVDFYLPGFVLGTIGVILMLVAVVVFHEQTQSIYGTVALLIGELVLSIVVATAAIKLVPQTAFGRKMILSHDQTGQRAQGTEHNQNLVGQQGVAQTVLRPAGMAVLDGKRHDVVAESGMIEPGSPIQVIAVDQNRIVVRKI